MENSTLSHNISGDFDSTNEKYAELRWQTDIAWFAISVMLTPVTVSGNLMVHISMFKFRKLRTVTNMFIGSLAMADCILGLITLPLYALFYIDKAFIRYKYLCLMKYSTVLVSMSGSLYSLVAISVDRYIAIVNPLKYPIIMTRKKAKIIISAIWTYHAILCAIPSFGWNNYDKDMGLVCDFFRTLPMPYTIVSCPGTILVSLVVTTVLYRKIFVVAVQYLKSSNNRNRPNTILNSQIKFQKETRSAKAMGMILFFFVIFWIPFMLTAPLKYLNIPTNLSETIKNFGMTIAMSNSAVNPFIYCWLRKDFRRAFYCILCPRCYKNDEKLKKEGI